MCDYGDQIVVACADRVFSSDRCLAGLLRVLNDGGVPTVASCCGHGWRPGNIALADGRELFVVADWGEGRALDRLFPLDIHGKEREDSP